MPAYAYEALDPKGTTLKGLIGPDNDKGARGLLRAGSPSPSAYTAPGQGPNNRWTLTGFGGEPADFSTHPHSFPAAATP